MDTTRMPDHEHPNIVYSYVIEKLEIPNSKKEKVNKNPGCTALFCIELKLWVPCYHLLTKWQNLLSRTHGA